MSWFLKAFLLLGLLWIAHPAHAQVCSPNPNTLGIGSFTDNCPMSASGLTKSLNKMVGYDVQAYGAKGDSATDDSSAIASAVQACGQAGGGYVLFPPTQHSYVIKQAALIKAQLAIAANCRFKGYGGYQIPVTASNAPNFYTNVEADWETAGSWIRCDDTQNACLDLGRQGQGVEDLNFWYTQPTPGTTTCTTAPCSYTHNFTPTVYPFTIVMENAANVNLIRNVHIVNGYDCIDVEGQANGFAGTFSSIENVQLACFHSRLKMHRIDNTLHLSHGREQFEWYQGSIDLFGAVEGTAGMGIGWDVRYVANLVATDWEFDWEQTPILLTDETVGAGFGALTFAGANWNLHGISFNETCSSFSVASSTTHFAGGSLSNAVGLNTVHGMTLFADTLFTKAGQCAAGQPLINLASDNVALQIFGLNVGDADTIAKIGAGSSGYLSIYGMRAQAYSNFTAGQAAFIAAANASLDLPGDQFSLVPAASAGPFVSGTATYMPFSIQAEGQINAPAGTSRELFFGTNPATGTQSDHGTSYRWGWRGDSAAESGANAGSNLDLDRYNDSGTYIDSPITVNRATGNVNLNDAILPAQKTVAGLPTCNAGELGAIYFVTDQSGAPTYLGALTGGGTLGVPAVCSNTSGSFRWEAH